MEMYLRKMYLSRLKDYYDDRNVKILVGIRRCGKSVIINQIIQDLKKSKKADDNHIIFISFEDIDNEELQDYKKLNMFVKDKIVDDKLYYLFVDEIQFVDNFGKVINSLRATIPNISIFITGSNSKLLPDELPSELGGRYIQFKINPFSYKEYVEYKNIDGYNEKYFWEYAKWGGLPNACDYDNLNMKKEYLNYVYDSIILRDVVGRLGLRDTNLLNLIIGYVLETIGREFSQDNIVNYLKNENRSVSNETIYTYLDALSKALLIKKVSRFDIHGKNVLKTLNKYYMTDLGLAYIKKNNPSVSNASILENIVYNELISRNYDVYVGKSKKGEIDFYVTKYDESFYIQVCSTLKDEKTLEREFGAFDVIDDNLPKYVFSLDNKDYSKNGIIHKNIIDWLLEK